MARRFVAVCIGTLLFSVGGFASDVLTSVRVRALTPAGVEIKHVYVALVPPWRPWNRPLTETIAEKGEAIFSVRAGEYGLVIAAPGFTVPSEEIVNIPEKGYQRSVTLVPLDETSGVVTDEKGVPLEGVRVSAAAAAIPAPLGEWSELAAGLIAPGMKTTTGGDGKWQLALPSGAVPVLFESPGRAAEWRVLDVKTDSSASSVRLSSGASLTVVTDREDSDLVVTIARRDDGGNMPKHIQPLVWARRDSTSRVAWDSLPAGEYEVFARYPDHERFMQAPVLIGAVTLAAGDAREITCALPAPRKPAKRVASLFLRGISEEDLQGSVEGFGSTKDRPVPLAAFVEDAAAGTVIHLNAEEIGPPYYAVTKEDFISSIPVDADARAGGQPAAGVVNARADVAFQFQFDGEAPPPFGFARLRDCPQESEVTVPLEISANGYARFVGAAGCRTLLFMIDPFEPLLTHKTLKKGDQWLGEFLVRASASADVRVTRSPGGEPVEGAVTRVMAKDDEEPNAPPVTVREGTSDALGWVHLDGLPTDRHLRVVAETPLKERSEIAPLDLKPRELAVIDPLSVLAPATLVVDAKIDPDIAARFPSARLVSLRIDRADPDRQFDEDAEQLANGKPLRFTPLRPGSWQIKALVKVEGTYAPLRVANITLEAGESRTVDLQVVPNVFEGIVTSHGKGVAAKVFILGDDGPMLNFRSDDSGIFHCVLQDRGVYEGTVARMSRQGNTIPVGKVAFTDPSRRIEIEIPDGAAVTARVKREGQPVANVTVLASRRNGMGIVDQATQRGRTTNDSGEVVFEDLAPGVWTVSLRREEGHSAADVSVPVEAGKDSTVNLELTDAAAIEATHTP